MKRQLSLLIVLSSGAGVNSATLRRLFSSSPSPSSFSFPLCVTSSSSEVSATTTTSNFVLHCHPPRRLPSPPPGSTLISFLPKKFQPFPSSFFLPSFLSPPMHACLHLGGRKEEKGLLLFLFLESQAETPPHLSSSPSPEQTEGGGRGRGAFFSSS